MQQRIFITGTGLISAIGNNKSACYQSLLEMQTGIGQMKHLQTIHRDTFMAGEVKLSNPELIDLLNITDAQKQYSRTALLGCVAVREAIVNAALTERDLAETALVSGTTVGGMDITELQWHQKESDVSFLKTHPCGDSTNQMAELVGIKGYRTTLSTACSSGANAIIHGVRLIRSGRAKRVIAGGVDALSKFTLNGFNSLMIVDQQLCQPFDRDRRGLNLGEGAGFVVLESAEAAAERGCPPLGELTGFANANDAYHQTASSPDGQGAYLSMIQALEMANLQPSEVSYINAHGTGTDNNDQSESIAIQRVFGEDIPPYSSTKAYTGHTLGAAAGVEAVISLLAIEYQVVFPNLRWHNLIDGMTAAPITGQCQHMTVNTVLSNSFGFGGNNSSLIFAKV